MEIHVENAGKRYNRDWIFKGISHNFVSGKSYAITGSNGSGKSTFLQAVSGAVELTEGKILWQQSPSCMIAAENIFKHFGFVAPYLDVVEEFTASEFLSFHTSFKPLLHGHSVKDVLNIVQLGNAANKQIRYFSSGMKQRLKLAQAVFIDVGVLLLDEPCTNLDAEGYALYQALIKQYCSHKLIIVSSNDINEYNFCDEIIDISKYKPA